MKNVIIYTLPNCSWCIKAKKLLKVLGVSYTELNEKFDGYPTVPYIVVDGKPIGGFTEFAAYCRKL